MKRLIKKLLGMQKKERFKKLSEREMGAVLDFARSVASVQKKKYASFEGLLWDVYPQFVKMGVAKHYQADPEYAKKGYHQGMISQKHVQAFLTLLKHANTRPISHDDYDSNYITHPDLRPHEKDLNASHKLFVLDPPLLQALDPILEELKEPVAKCLGSPWRIINVLCWETFPEALDKGPNSWHRDGLPFAVNKVMIYLTGASSEGGTTTLQFDDGTTHQVEGPIGTWLLFKISEILHKGEKPKTGSRIVLEVRVVPSFTFDLRPYCAGFNAHYPIHPWHTLHV
jgi:hypothetical protein